MPNLNDQYFEILQWVATTLPHVSHQGALGKLLEEVEELHAEPSSGEEAADVFIALVAHCAKQKIRLTREVERKMGINKQRSWREPHPVTGVVRHDVEKGKIR